MAMPPHLLFINDVTVMSS